MLKRKILIVDDDLDVVELISYNLTKEGYSVESANDGKVAVEKCNNSTFDLIILDYMIPEFNGPETCEKIRKSKFNKNTFILFLTARSDEHSEVVAFDSGANDFISKPIKPMALLSRVASILFRDKPNSTESNLVFGDLEINKNRYSVKSRSIEELVLPKKEFELLYFLASKSNIIRNREEILEKIWGSETLVGDRTIDVHIRKLREKLGEEKIKTIKGIGYLFVE
ncbi:MAG: response regulator transcription factor [Leadbetterella sp.]